MLKKKMLWILTAGIIVMGIVIGNILSNQKEPMRRNTTNPNDNVPKIISVKNKDILAPIEISGYLYAYDKVELYAEVSGVLQNTATKHFKEGNRYKKGEILIQIDDSVYLNNVLAQKSSLLNQLTLLLPDLSIDFPKSAKRWEQYLHSFTLKESINPLPEPASEKEKYYIASRNIYNSFFNIKSMEATLAKYTIRAPFAGVVTQSNINPGTLVRVGQKLGEFTNTHLYELEAPVGLFDLGRLRIGQTVDLKTEDLQDTFQGRIQRINSIIDRNSMTVKIYIQISDPRLRDGMYMTGNTQGSPIPKAFSLTKDLLIGENHIFVVEDSRLVQKKVEVVGEKGDRVIIRGLEDGTLILGEVWPEAREGMIIPISDKNLKLNHNQIPDSTEVK